jgi:hypothetical protein
MVAPDASHGAPGCLQLRDRASVRRLNLGDLRAAALGQACPQEEAPDGERCGSRAGTRREKLCNICRSRPAAGRGENVAHDHG